MAAPFPGWILDELRNQYYFYSEEEQAYIYQTGDKIYINATPADGVAAPCVVSFMLPVTLTYLIAVKVPLTSNHAPSHILLPAMIFTPLRVMLAM